MLMASSWVSALELSTRNMFRLYFIFFPCTMCVYGSDENVGTLLVWRLRAKQSGCFQLGSIIRVELWMLFLWVWAL
jgi:hypothetical protein